MIEIEYALAGGLFLIMASFLVGYIFGNEQGRFEASEIRDWHIRKVLNDYDAR